MLKEFLSHSNLKFLSGVVPLPAFLQRYKMHSLVENTHTADMALAPSCKSTNTQLY